MNSNPPLWRDRDAPRTVADIAKVPTFRNFSAFWWLDVEMSTPFAGAVNTRSLSILNQETPE
jgi:hypothetical protein